MNKKIEFNSIASVIGGSVISGASAFLPTFQEPVNYAGAILILGGSVFLDQAIMRAVYGEGRPPKRSLLRLAVYFVLATLLILLPGKIAIPAVVMRICRAFGTAFLLLALLKFFIYTTMEEQTIHD